MKALAIRQPYAWLIVHGHKKEEYRPWLTHDRGPVLVHATKAYDKREIEELRAEKAREGIIIPDDLPRAGIVGIVTLVDCIRYGRSALRPVHSLTFPKAFSPTRSPRHRIHPGHNYEER